MSAMGLAVSSGILVAAALCVSSCQGPMQSPDYIDAAGVDNLIRLNGDLFSGGEPKGEDAFKALSELGIKTVISVDGLRPDSASAQKYGMSTIHLPMGYSRVPGKRVSSLIKAVEVSEKPIYLHCHHGRHRAPAAAAVVARALYDWGAEKAGKWMRSAGTSPDYKGLYATVQELQIPTEAERATMPSDFTHFTASDPMVRIMAEVDRHWDNIKLIRAASWSRSLPELEPDAEALVLAELFRELSRSDAAPEFPDDMRKGLDEAAGLMDQLQKALKSSAPDEREERLFQSIKRSCKSCHHQYRN